MSRFLLMVLALVLAGLACSPSLRSVCESKCHQTKTVEPADFQDCMKRCQR